MIKELLNKINDYETIIIHRHNRPDLDALGSQFGLKEIINVNFPNKKIYAVGDSSNKYGFIGKLDTISDEIYKDALVIIVDVAVSTMVSDDRYSLAKEVYIIDHHTNLSDVSENMICDPTYAACAEEIADIAFNNGLKVTPYAATCLFGGIVTDSGRFQYSITPRTLLISSKLLECKADYNYIYSNIYTESLESKQMKAYFGNKFVVTKEGVGYLKNGPEVFEKFDVDFFTISRGMVSVMAGISEIKIWCNFTYDKENNKVIGEFRSRDIEIVQIAKKYGGGGHEMACGAPLESFEVADKVIEDFNNLLKEYNDVKNN